MHSIADLCNGNTKEDELLTKVSYGVYMCNKEMIFFGIFQLNIF